MDEDLKRLDKLITGFGRSYGAAGQSTGPCDLLWEHIQAARRYLLGAMPGEYNLSLQQAAESVACISSSGPRTQIKKILRNLMEPEAREHSERP